MDATTEAREIAIDTYKAIIEGTKAEMMAAPMGRWMVAEWYEPRINAIRTAEAALERLGA